MKQRYDSYKPSGIDWIGEIPSHWKLPRVKQFINICNGSDPKTEGDIPVYGSGAGSFKTCGEYKTGPTVLLGRKGATLHIPHWIDGKYWNVDTAFDTKVVGKYSLRLFFYSAMLFDYNRYKSETTLPSMTQTDYGNMYIPLPPLAEQEAIAAWLDEECGEIDAAIAKVDREIELIDELKQSEISRVVTRGLNPNVKLRPSGIEWIGEIPEHWKVAKLNKILDGIQDGTHATLSRVEDGELLLSAKNIFEEGIQISDNESKISKSDFFEIISNGFPKLGDIALCCVATIGRGCIYPYEYPLAFQRSVTFLRINKRSSNKYVLYYLRSLSAKAQFDTYAKTSAQSGVYMGDLKKFYISLPPLAEQREIASYLDKKCAEIDGLKTKLKKKRETLVELRQSLISEVVTGKRKII